MAITFSRDQTIISQRKNQNLLAILAVLFFVITGFVVWKGFFGASSQENPEIVISSSAPAPLQDVSIDFSVLSNVELFKDFTGAPAKALPPPVIGRSNPFLPL
ncbi:MAG: hypothetical protein HYT50_01705 [Candidatus Wildermuthbacteria bacterium]|nr:hypothetical protein [Candidatus Wildermuthbacteria bacterium]